MTTPSQPRFTLPQRLILAIVPRIVWALLWIVSRTWRFEVIAEDGVTPVLEGQTPGAEIYCFWHQCVLAAAIYFRASHAVILISQSFDGEMITRLAKMFGYGAVRGSSSRGAKEGLLGLRRVIKSGRATIFTADGPRGPVYKTKMGPIKLAQLTGAPMGAFHMEPEKAWVLRSWDRFVIPKPFTRICVSWVRWTHAATDLAEQDFESKRQELNAAIERARLRAYAHFGKAQA